MNEHKGNLNQAVEIFERASQLHGEAREAYLEGACGGNASLRADIDSMMEARAEQGEFLARPTADAGVTETRGSEQLGERPGTTIGRYKLLQRIGEGGFGVVYMAEQQEPVRRKVALKIIKLGMDTKQVIARFEAERQALAMMDHPSIARVFDAGATDTGRPYFVMELVKGVPVTEYCDTNNLSTKERLDLFMPVCNAIQHAHQKGIIHRDIKPSNVMVTLHDGKPVPKVIDFGIAKATDHRLTEKTLFTEYHQFIGTPAYMSPEQAEMSGLDVDTRTDIYSLGVLLYELLTGTTPFDPNSLREAAYGEIQRIIREVEPPKPSTRLSSLASEPGAQATGSEPPPSAGADIERGRTARAKARDSVQDIARHRRTDPSTLSKLIRGDLDWIVMKALEKDRTRRYETANEFAKDVERHLANEPIIASPPGVTYKLRKFIKRNRAAVTAGSLVAAALVAGLIVSTIGFVQASRQRDRAVVAEQQQSNERERAETARDEAEQARTAEAKQRTLAQGERDIATKAEQEARQQAYLASIRAAEAALATNDIGAVRRSLDAAPEEFRNWEWRYLDARSDNSLAIFPVPGHWVHCVAFNPDGTRLAAGATDRTVRLWDTLTGKELSILRGHEGMVNSVAFSPDGNRVASAGDDKTARLWDAITGEQLHLLRGHEEGVMSAAFSPDSRRLASASQDKTVRLWDTSTGEQLLVLRGHKDMGMSVAFSPDGSRLASGSVDGSIRIWDYVANRTRYLERQAIVASRTAAETIVGTLWQQLNDARSITSRLREDASLNEIACNDDTGGLLSQISFDATSAPAFFIRLASFGAPGDYDLNITCSDAPANDDCASALSVTDGAPAAEGDNSGASVTDDAEAGCRASDNDVWFTGTTNITEGLKAAGHLLGRSARACQVVLLSDGYHNTGPKPGPVAERLRQRAVLECVGIGGAPRDVDESLLKSMASGVPRDAPLLRPGQYLNDRARRS